MRLEGVNEEASYHKSAPSASAYSEESLMDLGDAEVAGYLDAPSPAQSAPAPMPTSQSIEATVPIQQAPQQPIQQATKPKATRMVFHQGSLVLKSTEPELALDSAEALTKGLGGYVESRSPGSMTLRIPVEKFRDSFERFLLLGVLVSKNLNADDITDQFNDTELRIKIAKASLERLLELLAESKDANEKIHLLSEIQRLTIQIEQDESRRKVLLNKAAYSQLNLRVIPFVFRAESDEPIHAFRWIQWLNPTRTTEYRDAKAVQLPLPSTMIDLDLAPFWSCSQGYWAAASNDGSELWAYTQDNNPMGDAMFWITAIRTRISKQFSGVEQQDAGVWKLLILKSFGSTPYYWMIATSTQGDRLMIAEALFPSIKQKDLHLPGVLKSLQEYKP